jgi:hypothetical protein
MAEINAEFLNELRRLNKHLATIERILYAMALKEPDLQAGALDRLEVLEGLLPEVFPQTRH